MSWILCCIFMLSCAFTNVKSCDLLPHGSRGAGVSCFSLKSKPYLNKYTSHFGPEIEGCSTNKKGQMFAVNYGNSSTYNTLGQFYPKQRLFYRDTNLVNSVFNGIRFFNETTAYVADKANHRVLQVKFAESPDGTPWVVETSNFCANSKMIQPNDVVVARTGTVFTSGMNCIANTNDRDGDIWSCTQSGEVKRLEVMGRTNGIELSPDDSKLYISESFDKDGIPCVQRLWVYDVDTVAGTISNKRLFADFAYIDGSVAVDLDGMRTDMSGNLWVSRNGGGQVMIFNSIGQVIGKITTNCLSQSNLEFGGMNGTTLYMTGQNCDKKKTVGCVDVIEVETPGRSWCMLQ